MIHNSANYRPQLEAYAAKLVKPIQFHMSALAELERMLDIGFYLTRRLIECNKQRESFTQLIVPVIWHPIFSAADDGPRLPHQKYVINTKKKSIEQRNPEFVCNRFIHSKLFMYYAIGNRVGGVLVGTDKDLTSKVYRISLSQIANIFEKAAAEGMRG
jgi:hypothetical protein